MKLITPLELKVYKKQQELELKKQYFIDVESILKNTIMNDAIMEISSDKNKTPSKTVHITVSQKEDIVTLKEVESALKSAGYKFKTTKAGKGSKKSLSLPHHQIKIEL